jgi:hypothetical protein
MFKSFSHLKTIAIFILALSLPILTTSFSPKPALKNTRINMSSSSALNAKPFVVCVEAEIKPDRMDDFLDIIEKDAVGSRAEAGCLRFGEF